MPRKGVSAASASRALPLGPWRGVRDVGDAGQQSAEYLQDGINLWFQDNTGGAVYARPTMTAASSTALGSGSGTVQCIHGITAADGTHRVFTIVDGVVYRKSGDTAWTDVTPVGPTISATAQMYAVTYNDEIIFSDGTNRPWRASGLGSSPITGTNIQVNGSSQAWSARNAPVVYGGKLFFVVNVINSVSYTSRIVWSEELDAATGYSQTSYTNQWDLVQTGNEKLHSLAATNVALYYFRQYSIGAIAGAVNATFTTTSTHDAVSQQIGSTTNPVVANGYVWFFDSDNKPMRFAVGSTSIEQLWLQFRRRFEAMKASGTYSAGHGVLHPRAVYIANRHKMVMHCLRESNGGSNQAYNLFVFDAGSGNYEGRWLVGATTQPASEASPGAFYISCIAGAVIRTNENSAGLEVLYVGGVNPAATAGQIWRMNPSYTVGDNSAAMHMSATTMLVPDEEHVEYRADLVALQTVPDTTAVTLDYYTPHGSSTGLSATGASSTDSTTYDHGICRWGLGAKAVGRWLRFVFHKNVSYGSTIHAFEKASVKVRVVPTHHLSP